MICIEALVGSFCLGVGVTLKFKNSFKLGLVLLVNVLIYTQLLNIESVVSGAPFLSRPPSGVALSVGAMAIAASLVVALVPPDIKAKIIFCRWRNPLPGCVAFSVHMLNDDRIDRSAILAKYNNLPSDPKRQNALWYKIYKKHCDDPSVLDAHCGYLFYRDYAVMAAALLVTGALVSIVVYGDLLLSILTIIVTGVQALLACVAARIDGVRLVKNVLSCESAHSD